jgi:hypothetical protein
VAISGRLTSTDGQPIANQWIVVTGTLRRTGARPQPVAAVQTNTGGRFILTVPAGPSQTLKVEYAGGPGLLKRVRSLALRVPASATIRAATLVRSGSGSIRFSGRLRTLGAPLPPGGKAVVLQGFTRGAWRTAGVARAAGPNAAWSVSAPFSGRPGRFRMRLMIPRDPTVFPYEVGYSPTVTVRVR